MFRFKLECDLGLIEMKVKFRFGSGLSLDSSSYDLGLIEEKVRCRLGLCLSSCDLGFTNWKES